jgi:hypothetical protein
MPLITLQDMVDCTLNIRNQNRKIICVKRVKESKGEEISEPTQDVYYDKMDMSNCVVFSFSYPQRTKYYCIGPDAISRKVQSDADLFYASGGSVYVNTGNKSTHFNSYLVIDMIYHIT